MLLDSCIIPYLANYLQVDQLRMSKNNYQFFDYHPKIKDFHEEILSGLKSEHPHISPKFFYDEKGSQIFAKICELPEYYPTRTEVSIIKDNLSEIASAIGSGSILIEPGSGNSSKVRLLLEELKPDAYLPMDISRDFLNVEASKLAAEYLWLNVCAVCNDFSADITLPNEFIDRSKVTFFPGSTIGNYKPEDALVFLKKIAAISGPDGGLLIGVDLHKKTQTLNDAYDDKAGVTAAFNMNLLTRINRELKADFDLDKFQHLAFYNEDQRRIEMHLKSLTNQDVKIGENVFHFDKDQCIHTEYSHKYTVESFQELAASAGFEAKHCWVDSNKLFSLHYFTVAS